MSYMNLMNGLACHESLVAQLTSTPTSINYKMPKGACGYLS